MMGEDFIDVFYRSGKFTNFGAILFHLIAKADGINFEKLRFSFPKHIELYEWWFIQPSRPSESNVLEKAMELEK